MIFRENFVPTIGKYVIGSAVTFWLRLSIKYISLALNLNFKRIRQITIRQLSFYNNALVETMHTYGANLVKQTLKTKTNTETLLNLRIFLVSQLHEFVLMRSHKRHLACVRLDVSVVTEERKVGERGQ